MQVEDRLPRFRADVDDDLVVLEARGAGGVGDEHEHSSRLIGRELPDVAKRLDVSFGNHEQVRLGLRIDVPDCDEAVRGKDVVPGLVQLAEETVVRQRGFPPP